GGEKRQAAAHQPHVYVGTHQEAAVAGAHLALHHPVGEEDENPERQQRQADDEIIRRFQQFRFFRLFSPLSAAAIG
ncbi:MAG: hypothetical protein LBU23_13975, partial [Planctomycetota bacterium]|nr:hypothetical protein [Planctomycetota bacterium]